MKSRSQRVVDFFITNPTANVKDVARKYKLSVAAVYIARKKAALMSSPEEVITSVEPAPRQYQVGGDHYLNMGIQPWDVVDTWPIEQRIGYYRGGALKYIMRMGSKDMEPLEIAKGKQYMEKLLELLNSDAPEE